MHISSKIIILHHQDWLFFSTLTDNHFSRTEGVLELSLLFHSWTLNAWNYCISVCMKWYEMNERMGCKFSPILHRRWYFSLQNCSSWLYFLLLTNFRQIMRFAKYWHKFQKGDVSFTRSFQTITAPLLCLFNYSYTLVFTAYMHKFTFMNDKG